MMKPPPSEFINAALTGFVLPVAPRWGVASDRPLIFANARTPSFRTALFAIVEGLLELELLDVQATFRMLFHVRVPLTTYGL